MTLHEFLIYTSWVITFALLMAVPSVVTQIILARRQRKLLAATPFFATWSKVQEELVDKLHHPHIEAQETDGLLEKLEQLTTAGVSSISVVDRKRLNVLLHERMSDPNQTESERTRAELLIFVMKRVQSDQQKLN